MDCFESFQTLRRLDDAVPSHHVSGGYVIDGFTKSGIDLAGTALRGTCTRLLANVCFSGFFQVVRLGCLAKRPPHSENSTRLMSSSTPAHQAGGTKLSGEVKMKKNFALLLVLLSGFPRAAS